MNCMLIGADPRFTAPFDPSKGFQYIWNPSLGQWQALPVPSQSSGPTPQGNIYIRLVHDQFTLKNYSNFIYFSFVEFSFVVILFDNFFYIAGTPKQTVLGPFASPMLNVSGSIPGTPSQYPGNHLLVFLLKNFRFKRMIKKRLINAHEE